MLDRIEVKAMLVDRLLTMYSDIDMPMDAVTKLIIENVPKLCDMVFNDTGKSEDDSRENMKQNYINAFNKIK